MTAAAMAGGRFSVEAVFKAVDRITAPVRRMQTRLQRFARAAARSLGEAEKVADKVIGGFRQIGTAAAAASVAVGFVLADVIKIGAGFERTMMSAAAKFGEEVQRGTPVFDALREKAEEVGASTEFTAQQAAGALDVFAAAGMDAEQAIGSLAGVGDLATVSAVDLNEAASLAADSLNALGLATSDAAKQAENMARLNDVMAATTTMANTSVNEMAEAIKTGGNTAMQSGQSLETFGAMVASMAQANMKGAEAGTAIRNVLLRLQAPAATGQRALRKLGVSIRDGNGDMRDITDVIGEMSQALDGMGSADRTRVLSDIFGARTIGAANALLASGADGLVAMRGELEGAEGAAGRMAATMRDTTEGDMASFMSAVEGIKIAVFGAVSGPFRDIVNSLREWASANREVIATGVQDFIDWFREALPDIVKWGRRIAVIAAVFLTVATAIKIATAAMAAYNFIMALNPIVAIATAVVAAIALIIAFWPEISAFFGDIWDGMKDIAGRIGAVFVSLWNGIKGVVIGLVTAIGGGVSTIWDPVREFLVGAFEFLVGVMTLAFAPIMPMLRPIFGLLVEAGSWVIDNWGTVAEFLAGVWESIRSGAAAAWGWISNAVKVVASTIAGAFSTAWNAISSTAQALFDRVKAIWEPIGEFFSGLWDGIASTFSEIFGGIVEAVAGVVDTVRNIGRDTLGSDGYDGDGSRPQVVSPQERVARTVSETTHTTRGEVTIRDQTGRAEVTRRPRSGAVGLRVARTGAF